MVDGFPPKFLEKLMPWLTCDKMVLRRRVKMPPETPSSARSVISSSGKAAAEPEEVWACCGKGFSAKDHLSVPLT